MSKIPKLSRAEQIVGDRRVYVRTVLARHYREGASVRSLAEATGRSYGWVHRLLTEAGVRLRPRGGDRRSERYRRGTR